MHYFDTNVLIYFMYESQDELKHKTSKDAIGNSTIADQTVISPLVFQEFIYTSIKIDKNKEILEKGFEFFKNFIQLEITKKILIDSFDLAKKLNYFLNINDCIHLRFAERHVQN